MSAFTASRPPTVFISYSHDSVEHKARVLALAKQLREDGVDVTLDEYETTPENGWPLWMASQIKSALFVLSICTAQYSKRISEEVDPSSGKGVAWEGRIVCQYIYDKANRARFIPVCFERDDRDHIPVPLQANTHYDLSAEHGYESLYRHLTSQPRVLRPPLGAIRRLEPEDVAPLPQSQQMAAESPDEIAVVGRLVDLRTFSLNFPPRPSREIPREQLVSTLESVLAGDVYLVTVEGSNGIGKTVLASQFADSFPERAITVFIRASSRLSYDPDTIRSQIAEQLHWAAYREVPPRETSAALELKYLYTEIQRKARKSGLVYYFVIDGLADIPTYASNCVASILELLPLGEEGFRFIVTGDLRLYTPLLHKSLSVKSFQVTQFALDDTFKYLEDLCPDRDLIKDFHKLCQGVPGRLADVRRSLESGTSPSDCLLKLADDHRGLFSLEWEQLDRKNETLSRIVSILAHDDKAHTAQTLGALAGVEPSVVVGMLQPLSFVEADPDSNVISFVSEPFRQFAADQLRAGKAWVHKANIRQLLLAPESDESLSDLPLHLAAASDFETLLEYLTPQHILAMLKRTHSLSRVQATLESGLTTAKNRERDADMLRFGIEKSVLVDFLVSGAGVTEAEALASLGDYSSATAMANSALLREDRLQILAAIGKAKRQKGQVLEPELISQIRSLVKQVDPKTLGTRAIDIAAHLICIIPDLALDMVDQAKPSEVERERAFARLSFLTLETLGEVKSIETLDSIKARGYSAKVDLLQRSMSILSREWSVPELLSHLERIEKPKDKLAVIRSWLIVNTDKDAVTPIIKYALDLAVRATEFLIDAGILRALADPLSAQVDPVSVNELIGMFDAQLGSAAKVGPFVEYARLQVALARAEVPTDPQAAENRIIGTFYETVQVTDIATKAEAWAWLFDGVTAIDRSNPYTLGESLCRDVAAELDSSFVALLDGTADHGRAAHGVIEALAMRHRDKAREYISMLNTEDRRNSALFRMVRTLFKNRAESLPLGEIAEIISSISDPFLRDDALEFTMEQVGSFKKLEIKMCRELEPIIHQLFGIINAPIRARVCAIAACVLNRSSTDLVELQARLLECARSSWRAIDSGWLRVKEGFELAELLSAGLEAVSAEYLAETEAARSSLAGFASGEATLAYSLSLRLCARAFSGLVKRRVYTKDDIERFALLVDALPDSGSRAIIWGELAIKCAVKGDPLLCSELVNERIRPLITRISSNDGEYKEHVLASVAPALYESNPNSALGLISQLNISYRDRAYGDIVEYLVRAEDPAEPEEYVPGSGYAADYSRLLQACDVLHHVDSDYVVYSFVERLVDTITTRRMSVQLTGSQKDEIYRRLQNLVSSKFPSLRHIRHEGYKLIARAQLARFRADPDPEDLARRTQKVPNTADRALVMFATGTAIGKTSRRLADRLLEDAKKAVNEIPSEWDRMERLIGFAYDAKATNPSLSRTMLEQAMKLVKRQSDRQSMRRIVDLAYRIDAVFAKDLAEKFDDDRVRKAAQRQIEVLQIKQKVVDEKPVYEELQVASRAEFRRLGEMLLGSLQSDRMSSVKPQAIRPCVQVASRQPIRESYMVLSWILENSIDRHASGEKAAYYLRPIFDATLAAAELADALANRTYADKRSARESIRTRAAAGDKAVRFPDREQSIAFLKTWLEGASKNPKQPLILCEPSFEVDDLLLLQLVKSSGLLSRIIIVTNRPEGTAPIGGSWGAAFRAQWDELSAQSPPPTRLVTLSPAGSSKPLITRCCLVSSDSGIYLSHSVRSIGVGAAGTFTFMEKDDVESMLQGVQDLLTEGSEWSGAPVRTEIYGL